DKLFRNAAERQADLEAVFMHHQVPELVLQDDGHLLRVLRHQARRQLHPFCLGQERNVEMMIAGQTALGRVVEHPTKHSAHRIARKDIISDVIGHSPIRPLAGRSRQSARADSLTKLCYRGRVPRSAASAVLCPIREMKWRLLLPGASEPRLTELNPSGLYFG